MAQGGVCWMYPLALPQLERPSDSGHTSRKRCSGLPRQQVCPCLPGVASRHYWHCCYYSVTTATICWIHYESGTVLDPFKLIILFMDVVFYLFLAENIWYGDLYSHFVEKSTESEKLSDLPTLPIRKWQSQGMCSSRPGLKAYTYTTTVHYLPRMERNLARPAPLVDLGNLRAWRVLEMGEPKLWDADKFVLTVDSGAGRDVAMLLAVVICPWWAAVDKKRQFCAVQETGS